MLTVRAPGGELGEKTIAVDAEEGGEEAEPGSLAGLVGVEGDAVAGFGGTFSCRVSSCCAGMAGLGLLARRAIGCGGLIKEFRGASFGVSVMGKLAARCATVGVCVPSPPATVEAFGLDKPGRATPEVSVVGGTMPEFGR